MRKLLSVVIGICMFAALAPAQTAQHVKWGKHKKAEPLVIPDAPFSIEVAADPREGAVQQYLDKKLVELRADLLKYPALQDQLRALVDEVTALKNVPVSDPDYAEKFSTMRATLLWVLTMEGYSEI